MSDSPLRTGGTGERTCVNCGATLSPVSRICASCGTLTGAPSARQPEPSSGQSPERAEEPPDPPVQASDEPAFPRRCVACGTELGPEARFCPQCGAPAPLAATEPPRPRFCTRCGSALAPDARFCSQCGTPVTAATPTAAFPPFPLIYEVEYPEKLSRLLIFVKWLLVIPQLLVVYALGQVSGLIAFLAFFCILFTKRYPHGLFNLVVGFNRWSANVTAYFSLLRDEYPPFSTDTGRYPVRYDVDYPESLSRWLIWVKWFLVFPHYLALFILTIVALPVFLIAWFAILFTGRFPRRLFNYIVGVTRWQLRVNAYSSLMRDEFPPYGLSAGAKPGGWRSITISLAVGILGIFAVAGAIVALASLSSSTQDVAVRYEALLDGFPSPSVSSDGTEVTLVHAADPYLSGQGPRPGNRQVEFTLSITNRDSLLTSVGEQSFRLKDNGGRSHAPRLVAHTRLFETGIIPQGESVVVDIVFEIDEFDDPAELTYSPGFAAFSPFGESVRFLFH